MSNRLDRIIGVDIAKIVAMLLVVAVHVNGFGLPYIGDNRPGLCYLLLRSFLGAIFMACINIFAMASGYVGITASFKLSRLIRLWIQVAFTGLVVLACIDFFMDINVQVKDYLKACVPIAKQQYWYMTAYFMLCFVRPLLNAGIKSLAQKDLRNMIILLLCIICGESFICSAGALGVAAGYSFEWLVVLYVVGAYMRLYNSMDKSRMFLLECVCFCAMIVGWIPPVLKKFTLQIGMHTHQILEFGGYTSPFTVLIAIFIFSFCLKIRIASERTKKVLNFLSSTTLGVYLIHVQPVFFRDVFRRTVGELTVSGGWDYFYSLIVVTMVVYIACTILDLLRIMLFRFVKRLFLIMI